ncbi:MAG TPA: hypothetical protein PLX97_00390 [Gemmatales bacterium]|nr:hypothetical protein [Gemmatales bacterium]
MSQNTTSMTPEQELNWVHHKRQALLDQLEAKVMADEKTPVSLLSLYRNTLRDHEAACYKRLDTMNRDPQTATPAANAPAAPKGKSMLTHCLVWFAAMLTMLFASAAQAQATISDKHQIHRAVCGSAGGSTTHLDDISKNSELPIEPSDRATTTLRTPPVSD